MPIRKRTAEPQPLEVLLRTALQRQSDAEWVDDMEAAAKWANKAESIQKRLDNGELYGASL